MRLQAIAISLMTVLCGSLSHAQDTWDQFETTRPASPQHLQINDNIRTLFEKGIPTLENEEKTVKVFGSVNAIKTILGCTIQSIDQISLETDSFNFIKTQKIYPKHITTVMYQPISQTRIKEVWGINTTDERTRFYEKANFIDPSQYHGVKDKERVITYLGETSSPLEFWIKSFSKRYLSKYTETPWRVSVYINTNILCIKLNNKAVTHEQNVPQKRLNQYN